MYIVEVVLSNGKKFSFLNCVDVKITSHSLIVYYYDHVINGGVLMRKGHQFKCHLSKVERIRVDDWQYDIIN